MHSISIIVPAYNEEKYLGDCLRHILSHKSDNVVEVLVVCNACTDTTESIAGSFRGVRVVHEPRKGLSFAKQRGVVASHGSLLAFLDADTRVERRWFDILNQEFSSDPSLVCLSGPYEFYDVPSWQRVAVQLYFAFLARPTYFFTQFMALGGNLVLRRDALTAVGGFDERIDFYGEDTDIARRISTEGRVRFLDDFRMSTSGRRFKHQGIIHTGIVYAINFLSEAVFKRPLTSSHEDYR